MSHMPVNHHLRPLYRVLAALAALYILVFGIVGVVEAKDQELFGRGPAQALGLHTNRAFAVLSIVVGVVVLLGLLVGRNVDRFINFWSSFVFLGAGMLMLTVLQTDANFLNFTVSTCIVSFVIGLVLFLAGMYGRKGTPHEQRAEEDYRQGRHGDHVAHKWQDKQHKPEEHQTPEEQEQPETRGAEVPEPRRA